MSNLSGGVSECFVRARAGKSGQELPSDAQFHENELKSLDSATGDVLNDILDREPSKEEWYPPCLFAYSEAGKRKSSRWTWLECYLQGLSMSKAYLETLISNSSSEIHMGDVINFDTAGNVVIRSTTGDLKGTAKGKSLEKTLDLDQRADELRKLRKEMRARGDETPESDINIAAVAQAEKSARTGDAHGVFEHLKTTGEWCLDVATKLGVNVASEAIKHAIGLSK